ncbi:hypothetical protein CAEBREN_00037 [Caenorhabditis brenneri]|uniref:Uncharacterized protein n=1 Tax=Caenorhabditis brenneri TaxID=135651 RepID=G0N803_CAEBE|nr:hypothetical protein CAEBREN_00037 [Caenorhabditis brenneri]
MTLDKVIQLFLGASQSVKKLVIILIFSFLFLLFPVPIHRGYTSQQTIGCITTYCLMQGSMILFVRFSSKFITNLYQNSAQRVTKAHLYFWVTGITCCALSNLLWIQRNNMSFLIAILSNNISTLVFSLSLFTYHPEGYIHIRSIFPTISQRATIHMSVLLFVLVLAMLSPTESWMLKGSWFAIIVLEYFLAVTNGIEAARAISVNLINF